MHHREETTPPSQRRKVSQEVIVGLLHQSGMGFPIDAELQYDTADPYAVTIAFREPGSDVQWTFARDLLTHGLFEPTGDGDVHVYPSLLEDTTGAVTIELCPSHGAALIEVNARDLSLFLAEIHTLVAVGTESSHLDIDRLVASLLATHDKPGEVPAD